MEFEKVFPELATYGRYQRLIYLFVLLPVQLPLYVHLFSHLFLTYQPPHWCKSDHLLGQITSFSPSTSLFGLPSTNASSAVLLGQSLQSNEAMRRFFFTPSTFVVRSWTSSNSAGSEQVTGLLNVSQILESVNYSLLEYVQRSLSSCTLYNASQEDLVRFHQHFLQLFTLLTPPLPSNTQSSNSSSTDSSNNNHNNRQSNIELLLSPPIAECTDWTFNETGWLGGGDQSIVTKVSLL